LQNHRLKTDFLYRQDKFQSRTSEKARPAIARVDPIMNLNDLLNAEKLDPDTTLVMRHVPRERELRKVLPWLAAERPDVFNAYQQTQNPKAEKQILRAKYVASFIGHGAGKALFVGLYEMRGAQMFPFASFLRFPSNNSS